MVPKVIDEGRLPSITDQFNPFIDVANLSEDEMSMQIVKDKLHENQVELIRIKDLAYEEVVEVLMEDYYPEDYPEGEYQILDTVQSLNSEFSELSLRDYVVSVPKIYLIIAKDLKSANWNNIQKYKDLTKHAKEKNIPIILMTSSGRKEIDNFKTENQWPIAVFSNDEIELKAITRSNPALLYIENGVVKAKFAHRSTPSIGWIKNNLD
mgnify:CR=1 FL=1